MNEGSVWFSRRSKESVLSSISAGLFLVLAGAIFVLTPNPFEEALAFFRDFSTVRVPHFDILLPAPQVPEAHLTVYSAVELFCLVWGFFQVLMLALRFAVHSPLGKKAETLSNIIFWFGAAFLIQKMLLETTRWFEFWTVVIMLIGFSLVIRAVFLAAVRHDSRFR